MTELQPIIVFHGRHFVRHLGICNPICVKLLEIMSGVIPRNLKKNDISISNRFPGIHKRGIQTHRHIHTHTDTHDDSIRQNAIRCISPKKMNDIVFQSKSNNIKIKRILEKIYKKLPGLTQKEAIYWVRRVLLRTCVTSVRRQHPTRSILYMQYMFL